MYKPEFFELYELISREFYHSTVFNTYQKWVVFDERVLITNDRLRRRYGPMEANNWYWGGGDQWRGFRDSSCTIGADLSQHRLGRGQDLEPKRVTAEEIRKDILIDPFHPDFEFISCIEAGVPWLHFDCRNRDKEKDGILVVYRKNTQQKGEV